MARKLYMCPEFVITEDHLDNVKRDKAEIAYLKSRGFRTYFRLYDDDGELYFTGYLYSEEIAGEEVDEFAPLDWAMYDSGCTEIKYRNAQGRLETL